MSDYLWDKTGEDPEVERLELALSPLAYRGAPPRLPRRWPILISAGIAAAGLLLVLWRPWRPLPTGWEREGHALAAGEWLESGDGTQLLSSDLGRVQLRPGTRVRVIDHGRLELEHGGIEATIAAAPRRFSVATHNTLVIDLGCAFELRVAPTGVGQVRVSQGRVALSQAGREVVVPSGAACDFTPDGPGTPEEIQPPPVPSIPIPALPPAEKTEPQKSSPKPHAAVQKSPAALQKSPAAPKNESQKSQAPKNDAPKNDAPKNDAPKNDAPKNDAPKNDAPKNDAPKNQPLKSPPQKAPAKTDPGLHLQHDSLKDLDRSL